MYIMVKTYQKLELFDPDLGQALSILESRKTPLADLNRYSGRLQSRSTPKRIGLVPQSKSGSKRGLRKSSSLTNGISPGRNKTALKEYGTETRGLAYSSSMRPSWTPPLMRSV
jgi:hypothetical protein